MQIHSNLTENMVKLQENTQNHAFTMPTQNLPEVDPNPPEMKSKSPASTPEAHHIHVCRLRPKRLTSNQMVSQSVVSVGLPVILKRYK